MKFTVIVLFMLISSFCFDTLDFNKGIIIERYINKEDKTSYAVKQVLLHTIGLPVVIVWYFWVLLLCIALGVKDWIQLIFNNEH